MKETDETILTDVKTAYNEELKEKEKEDIENLQRLLRQLFQLQSDDQLNYGIYRIMNEKRSEVEQFVKETLPEQVKKACADLTPEIARQHRSFIFSHIHTFFSRYYEKGDFMPLRRYSAQQKYAIPYNGEEVFLHWANKDQYYIKTGEFFANSAFRVGEYTIRFRTVQAETVQDNVKATDRYFLLASFSDPAVYDAETKELTVALIFRILTHDEQARYGTRDVQKKINEEISDIVLSSLSDDPLRTALSPKKGTKASKKDDRGVLFRNLTTYTHKNTTDFFIHKDLGGFLTRELDFYIKNEVFHLEDLGSGTEVPVQMYVSRARIIKKIGEDIIAFLAQIEEFQKRLFEKKKFVFGCNYCLTLDRVPQELWPEILENTEQLAEWEQLYGIGSGEQQSLFSGYDTGFLEAHPFLMIDTKFFEDGFTDRLLGSFKDLDESIGGLMIHSENFQALNLLQERYRESVKCVYIDPPYNIQGDEFIYRDNFQHSCWLSMMYDRLNQSISLLIDSGFFFSCIDDSENFELRFLLNAIFGANNFIDNVIWKKRYGGGSKEKYLVSVHEYIYFYGKSLEKIDPIYIPLSQKSIDTYYKYKDDNYEIRGPYRTHPLEATKSMGYRANLVYPIRAPDNTNILPRRQWLWQKDRTERAIEKNEIEFIKTSDKWTVHTKQYLKDESGKLRMAKEFSIIDDVYTQHGTNEILSLFNDAHVFSFPKPSSLIQRIIQLATQSINNEIFLDYFAGSGTTAHAILSLNKKDEGSRKYILVEMADYVDTVMKPRIQKVCYSSNWKEGLPKDTDGQSHIFKYFSLESYEEALHNITFDTTIQKTLTDLDGYFLNYLLDFETRNSPCRLAIDLLKHPFDYTLKVIRDQTEQTVAVDLPETFAYLIGLLVKIRKTYTIGPAPRYLVYHGTTREGTVTVIWRDCETMDLTRDKEYVTGTILKEIPKADLLYMNGEFIVPGARGLERIFKEQMGA